MGNKVPGPDRCGRHVRPRFQITLFVAALALVCFQSVASAAAGEPRTMSELDAGRGGLMGTGINIGNTLENTTTWEPAGEIPPNPETYRQSRSARFKTIRLPVAWDTYAKVAEFQRQTRQGG